MAYRDLREFVAALEQRGLLRRITDEVDAALEITAITDRVCKADAAHNLALLFENVRGYDMPVLMNAFGSCERMALALGVNDVNDVAGEIRAMLSLLHKRPSLSDLLPLASHVLNLPRHVSRAPCQEVIEREPSLDALPILTCWPQDGGPFITLPLVFTKNPRTGKRNVGMYRLQKYDATTTGMHWHLHKNGADNYRAAKELGLDRLEVAVAIGADPALTYAATAPLPPDLDEMLLAGFLRHKAVELTRCVSVDLDVPAAAEIVLEGYVNVDERRREGPFGDHTGYYSLADDYPVFHLTALTHRRNPIYAATVVGRPPMEDCYLAKATERIFLPLLQEMLPEVVDLNLPLAGVFHNCAMVSIRKSYPMQARKVMAAIWGLGQMMFTKLVIVVDAHVNVQDEQEVWWRVYNNIDARRDLVLMDGPLDALDHASPHPLWGTKLGIDATRKLPGEGHPRPWPDEIAMPADVAARVAPIVGKILGE